MIQSEAETWIEGRAVVRRIRMLKESTDQYVRVGATDNPRGRRQCDGMVDDSML